MARDPLAPHEHLVDTAMVPDDDDPDTTDDGYTWNRPEFDEFDMLRTLEKPPIGDPQAELPPQEAYDLMKFSAPLDKEEEFVLDSTPFLQPEGGLSFVDDADHDEWLMNRMRDKRGAMDNVLEDQMYGDDLGFGLSSITRAVKGAARAAAHAPGNVARAAAGLVKKFVPNRDAQKAALVRQTNTRLVNGRANFLQMTDVRRGVRDRPRSYYLTQARPWARSRLTAGGLPTTYTSGEVAATILGEEDMMGSWWNPFSWFQQKTKYVVQNAQGQIAEMSESDFQAWMTQQQQAAQAPADLSMQQQDPSATPPDAYGPPPDADAYADQAMGLDRWERDIDLHSWVEDATRGKRGGLSKLQEVAKKAAAGDQDAIADMNEVRNYQKQIGVHVMGNEDIIVGSEPEYEFMVGDEDAAGAFSDFAGDVLGEGWQGAPASTPGAPRRRLRRGGKWISDARYRAMTMRAAQRATGQQSPNPAAVSGAHNKLITKVVSRGIDVRGAGGESMMGAWLYKLSPAYWLKPARERRLIDAEKTNWQKTQDSSKSQKTQEEMLEAGRRAAYQADQARAAAVRSQELEAELQETEKTIASGDFVGADPSEAVEAAKNGQAAAAANGARAGKLAAKLESGEKLSPEEVAKLRNCLKMCRNLRALHAQLHSQSTSSLGYHDFRMAKTTQADFLGENVAEILGENPAEILGAFVGGGIPKAHLIAMTALAAGQPGNVAAYARKNGLSLSASDIAAIRAASQRARAIMKHPQYGQTRMKGKIDNDPNLDIDGDSSMGFSWTKLLTAPLAVAALPAAALAWGAKKVVDAPVKLIQWGAQKGGWGGAPGVSQSAPTAAPAPGYPPGAYPPPAQYGNPAAQAAAVAAARQRQLAARARINAARAQTAQSQQQYAAEAAAADAEAAAQQAEADAQQAQYPDAYADESGAGPTRSGRVTVLGAEFFSGAFVGEIEDDKAKKIVLEAQKNTPTGKKIRAGATLYGKARKGDKKSKLALAKIQAKAEAGDPQAQRDYNAVKAGKIAVHAKGRAQRKIALRARHEAANRKGVAVRKRVEAAAGRRLGEHTRRKKLAKIAKIEHLHSKGHRKAKVAVARVVARAHAGDPKAKSTVAALQLARHVRRAGNTPAERKRLHAAHKVVYKARRGNKKAIRTIALIDAAAKKGQPNARRARARLAVAARVEQAVATGRIAPPSSKATAHAAAHRRILHVKNRIATGVATREEALGAAKLAKATGDDKLAADFALQSNRLPSATKPIKDAAAVTAAANNGSKDAQAIVDRTLEGAKGGDPKAINSAGKLAAAQAVDAVNKGRPMPRPIADATLIVERAHAGDQEAKRTVERAGAAAQDPDHQNHSRAVEAAVALTAASAVLAATAANAAANKHWRESARKETGHHIDSSEQASAEAELAELVAKLHQGTASYRDGLRARHLAVALGKTKLAAEISAIMPPRDSAEAPMSSLPDGPEPEIRGPMDLLRESLRALSLATSDPFSNWREGVRSRGG